MLLHSPLVTLQQVGEGKTQLLIFACIIAKFTVVILQAARIKSHQLNSSQEQSEQVMENPQN